MFSFSPNLYILFYFSSSLYQLAKIIVLVNHNNPGLEQNEYKINQFAIRLAIFA